MPAINVKVSDPKENNPKLMPKETIQELFKV
jgi:hypothetical protein